MKTKPTQASVKELQGIGIQPDVIVCRSEHPLTTEIKDKIALFCNVPSSHVLQNLDVEYLYELRLPWRKRTWRRLSARAFTFHARNRICPTGPIW